MLKSVERYCLWFLKLIGASFMLVISIALLAFSAFVLWTLLSAPGFQKTVDRMHPGVADAPRLVWAAVES